MSQSPTKRSPQQQPSWAPAARLFWKVAVAVIVLAVLAAAVLAWLAWSAG